jgi:hypothetical protein
LVVVAAVLVLASATAAEAASLRFRGHGGSAGDNFVFPDRVKIWSAPPAAANVGATDFTIEFWMRATADENPNPAQACGFGIAWTNSHIVIDRDRYNQGRKFGIGILGGAIAFGASSDVTDYTLCGTANVLDGAWHHVAVGRRFADGRMWIWVDGGLDATGPASGGPAGDLSYPAAAVPGLHCSPDGGGGTSSCQNSDPYLVFGAEKHGYSGINYSGWLDEVRLSNVLRYTAPFARPSQAFTPDAQTAALYHFDEGMGAQLLDASGGGSHGQIFFGGEAPPGPEWSSDDQPTDIAGFTAAGLILAISPSPFTRVTTLQFDAGRAAGVALVVYDVAGRPVRHLIRGEAMRRGTVHWSGDDDQGRVVPAGVYFARLETPAVTRVQRIVRLH